MKQDEMVDLKVAPRTVHREAVQKIREAIFTGIFKPGQRLVEADLSSLLAISRASVREALRSLEAEKLISIVANKGPVVPILSWEEAEEIYYTRALLEGEAAALFVRNATLQHLRDMNAALTDFQRAADQNDAVERLNATSRFYDVIVSGCGNRILHELLGGLNARITFLRSRSMSRAGRAKHSAREMRRILAAIEAGDVDGARRAAVDHVQEACKAARVSYAEDNGQ